MSVETLATGNADIGERLLADVQQALASNTPLAIRGGNSKAFLGRPVRAPS